MNKTIYISLIFLTVLLNKSYGQFDKGMLSVAGSFQYFGNRNSPGVWNSSSLRINPNMGFFISDHSQLVIGPLISVGHFQYEYSQGESMNKSTGIGGLVGFRRFFNINDKLSFSLMGFGIIQKDKSKRTFSYKPSEASKGGLLELGIKPQFFLAFSPNWMVHLSPGQVAYSVEESQYVSTNPKDVSRRIIISLDFREVSMGLTYFLNRSKRIQKNE